MPFWDSALSEPRRSHRFILTLPNLDEYQQYLAKKVTKPSFKVGETPHKFLGNTYYYPGSVEWSPVSCTIVNAVNPDGNDMLYKALVESGYLPPDVQYQAISDGRAGTVNKSQSLEALGDVVIQELDGRGIVAGTWKLMNSFITEAKFGDLDYSSDDILNIDLTFRYDWGQYVVGRAVGDNQVDAAFSGASG